MGHALLCVLADWRSAGSHLQPPPPPSLSPPRLQADVDAAIQKLQDLKLDREAKLKVWGGGGGVGAGGGASARRPTLPSSSLQAYQAASGAGGAESKEAFRAAVVSTGAGAVSGRGADPGAAADPAPPLLPPSPGQRARAPPFLPPLV